MKSGRMRLRGAGCLMLLGALVAAGCGDSGAAGSTTDPAATQPSSSKAPVEECTADRVGGALKYGQYLQPVGLDPASPYGARGVVGGTEMAAIYDTLLRYNPDSNKYEPYVAESFSSNTDASEWTVKLRPGVKFGNGDPLTSQAVKASTLRHADPNLHSAMSRVMAKVASIETPDPLTVVYKLTGPFSQFPWFLAVDGGMVVNPNVVTQLGDKFSMLPKGAGVGPYEPASFTPGESVVLKAKTDYWGGPVCVGTLTFSLLGDSNTTYEAIKSGGLDLGMLRDATVIKKARDARTPTFTNTYGMGYVLRVNADEGRPGHDVRVREAIASAIDLDTFNQRVFDGNGTPNSAIVARNSIFGPLEGVKYDPQHAKSLVDQVKADSGWNGTLDLTCSNDPISQKTAIAVQAMLKPAGINLVPNLVADNQVRQARKEYDTACSGAAISDSSTWIGLANFASPRNLTGYVNATYDSAMDDLLKATTVDQTKTALKKIQQIWTDTMPTVALADLDEVIAWRDGVKGLRFGAETLTYFGDAYIK